MLPCTYFRCAVLCAFISPRPELSDMPAGCSPHLRQVSVRASSDLTCRLQEEETGAGRRGRRHHHHRLSSATRERQRREDESLRFASSHGALRGRRRIDRMQ
jgi:hypothetical protein